MAQTIEGFVSASMDEAPLTKIHWRVFALIALDVIAPPTA
jgi:hypothetical protein